MEKRPTNQLTDKKLRKGSDDLGKVRGSDKPLRVLIVDDSQEDAVLVLRELKRGGFDPTYERVDTAEAMTAALARRTWEIIISDHNMPRFSSMGAIALLKQSGMDIPCLVVSGTAGEELAVACMKAGASDYILKGALMRLGPAIERELREAQTRREKRLAEEQFRQAQKMEPIGRLAAGVAHDFNNLLTAIMGYSELMLPTFEKGDARRDDIEEIVKTAGRAAVLTRQLLAFSRKQILDLKVLDLNAVVANINSLIRRLIGEDVEIVTVPGKDLGRIKADAGQIEQVIINLTVNARDAMPDGGRLVIETADAELDETHSSPLFQVKPGPYVMLTISDTGCGMDGETLSHLFEPFFTTKEQGKGTGLGLSTVYGIVKQSSGYIWVDSAPGRGTTFRIYFPGVTGAPEPLGTAAPAARSLKGSETILLAEDEESVRNLVHRVLTQYGYTVLAATDVEAAVRICGEHQGPIHLLVTDVVMPRMSGGDLAREIARLRSETRVLYLSGYTDSVVAQKGVLKSGIHFLQKPFAPENLARKVREVLEEERVKASKA